MANEKRMIDANDAVKLLRGKCVAKYPNSFLLGLLAAATEIEQSPTVDAVVLPYTPRPMLKDRNPYNTDVYCPECGTNLSGYYGDEPLPIVTCFNCGEILDPYKATTGTDGERKYNEID